MIYHFELKANEGTERGPFREELVVEIGRDRREPYWRVMAYSTTP